MNWSTKVVGFNYSGFGEKIYVFTSNLTKKNYAPFKYS